jgi:ligand-binding SRPBCC domain-containing protein
MLKTHHITSKLEMPLPIERVFDFFSKAGNLERITPPELKFEIISDNPIKVSEGAQIEYRLRLYGISFKWNTLIRQWIPGRQFVDEQIQGPYKSWLHVHEFEQTPTNGSIIHDSVTYALPMYPFGEAAIPIVRLQLRRIFTYRQIHVIKSMGIDPAKCSWHVDCSD